MDNTEAEHVAQRFHEAYERLAPSFAYETRKASAKPWAEVPENNRRLMIAVVVEVMTAQLAELAAESELVTALQAQLAAHAEMHARAVAEAREEQREACAQAIPQLNSWREAVDAVRAAPLGATPLADELLVANNGWAASLNLLRVAEAETAAERELATALQAQNAQLLKAREESAGWMSIQAERDALKARVAESENGEAALSLLEQAGGRAAAAEAHVKELEARADMAELALAPMRESRDSMWKERDEARAERDELASIRDRIFVAGNKEEARLTAERDAARAERDGLRAALEKARPSIAAALANAEALGVTYVVRDSLSVALRTLAAVPTPAAEPSNSSEPELGSYIDGVRREMYGLPVDAEAEARFERLLASKREDKQQRQGLTAPRDACPDCSVTGGVMAVAERAWDAGHEFGSAAHPQMKVEIYWARRDEQRAIDLAALVKGEAK